MVFNTFLLPHKRLYAQRRRFSGPSLFLLEPCGVLSGTTKYLSKTHGPCYNSLSPRHKSTDCKSKHTAAESAEDCTILLHEHANADSPQSSDGTTVHLQKVVDRKAACVLPQMAIVTAKSGIAPEGTNSTGLWNLSISYHCQACKHTTC